MGVQLVRGRWLTPPDRDSLAPVVLVNEQMVEMGFEGKDAIGRRIEVNGWRHLFPLAGMADARADCRDPHDSGRSGVARASAAGGRACDRPAGPALRGADVRRGRVPITL